MIAREPTLRLRDIAATLDITERAAQRIVSELVEEGYLTRKREGRRNTYEVQASRSMRAPQVKETEVGEVLEVFLSNQDPLETKG